MSKILWIINKYVGSEESEEFFSDFLLNTQKELDKNGNKLSFVFFSDLLSNNQNISNKFVFRDQDFHYLSKKDLDIEAFRIEKYYDFTFKQAYFADIIQVFEGRSNREISVPEKYYSDLSFLVKRFLFLEELLSSQEFDVIFMDMSPEVEMEFARVIANKLNKIVLKAYEGSALGGTVLMQLFDFGKDRWVVTKGDTSWTKENIKSFCKDFIEKRRLPYEPYSVESPKKGFASRFLNALNRGSFFKFPFLLLRFFNGILRESFLIFEQEILKKGLYQKFDPKIPNFFMGFHLGQESTMGLRSQPFMNQISLVEMISRVLPYNHVLYVREHPHWPKTFSYTYLKAMKKNPSVKLISPKISIHDILKDTVGVITYNSTTGIEALLYKKPVLSFASNIYFNHHPGVDQCIDLYELGKKLSQLANREVAHEDTVNYIYKLKNNSLSFGLGSYNFYSEKDSKEKAISFSLFLEKSIKNTINDEH